MAKQNHQTQKQKDDALFEALGRSKKRKKRKILITVISIVLILAIVLVAGINILKKQVQDQFGGTGAEVLSYTASTGTISTVVSGSGTLTDVDMLSVTVPDGVEITEVLVQRYATVAEGDVLATVDMSSVISAMADLQKEMDSLDQQIAQAEAEKIDDTIAAGIAGRVKVLYAHAGTAVANTMVEYGALAYLSLDGYMAVDVATTAVSAGDEVAVKLSDGSELTGTVESVKAGYATVLVSDEDAPYKDQVSVYGSNGNILGSGVLYIHNALAVTGYAGTVADIHVDVDDKVSAGTTLFTLEDTSFTANYATLLRSRSEKEAQLLDLLTLQKNGAVLAPIDGSIYSVDYSSGSTSVATISRDEAMSITISVDESDILSLELGQEVDVYVTSVSEDAFEGTLAEINRTSSSSGTYSPVITVEKAEGMLSGMTASASVKIEGVEDALLIPLEALHQTSSSAYVYTTYDEDTKEYGGKVTVTIGLQNSQYVEITSGLSEGDVVYYTEQNSMNNMFGGGEFPGFGGGEFPGGSGGFPGGSGEFPGGGGGFPGGGGGFGGFG